MSKPVSLPVRRFAPAHRCGRLTITYALATLLSMLSHSTSFAAANTNNEQQLVAVLQSNASLAEKDAACARLKWLGSARAVPALARLLTDEQLSHSARYALESMDLAAAGRALTDALKTTSGLIKAGIINSLAARGEIPAAPAIVRALGDRDPAVATAAAHALGEIGAPAAYRALLAGVTNSNGALHQAEVRALLRWGSRLQANGHESRARELYQKLYDTEKSGAVRVAAYRGLIFTSPKESLDLVIRAIPGPPGPSQLAALQVIHELPGGELTAALTQLLPQLEPSLQVPVIGSLAQRGDSAATPAINALASSPVPEVRLAALRALDLVGDASSVPVLSDFAATGTPDEQRAGRQALQDLRRGNINDALLEQMANAGPSVQVEAARALGNRGDRGAVPRLFEVIDQRPDPVRKAAFQALGQLAGNEDVAPLTQYVLETGDESMRAEAALALRTACGHIQAQTGNLDVRPVISGLNAGSPQARIALLPICSSVVSPLLRVPLRDAVQDPNPAVRDAAITALCDTMDVELLPDIVAQAHDEKRDNFRLLAINGGIRLATQEETVRISNGQRIAVLSGLLASASRPQERKLVLSGLADVATIDSLRVVEGLLGQEGTQTEACRAALKIAVALPSGDAHESVAVLNKALGTSTDPGTQEALRAAIRQIQASANYLTEWQVAGPYRQAGKDYSALFDILFPPELDNAKDVSWRPLPAGTDPKRPWAMDLLKALGGQQCVAYARTWVHCDADQTARLELGSDDGIKVWLNDKQVYTNNVSRSMQPGSDKVEVQLHSGWNRLLFKVTQNNRGWEFCARLLKPNGAPVEGLRSEAAPHT